MTTPWISEDGVTPVPPNTWTQYRHAERVNFWTWRQKWQGIRAVLRGRIEFSVSVWLYNPDGKVYLDDLSIEVVE
jgi:hypothetical protein